MWKNGNPQKATPKQVGGKDGGETSHANFIIAEEPPDAQSPPDGNDSDAYVLPESQDYTQESTGLVFPTVLQSTSAMLVANGVRTKFRVKVYGVGVYVDPRLWKGKDKDAWDVMLNDPTTPITLYIVLSRELSSQKMISGLMAALTPFLTNDKESAKKFEGFNPKDATFAVNSVLRFDVGDSVTKYTHPEGKQHVLASREFARGLKGVYFDGKGVIGGLKDDTMEGLRKL
ncbi:hypothetical protein TrCOL_g5476 [Triparma columacea]|uniref:Chalcone isomerase domain-containing protein n=1 Tax=Triparma columacea TaxID=722753 RepID=A0A9W7LC16_9STRA|nr:hypothetical protein TrCOL_g5476 [Triparma columacea]